MVCISFSSRTLGSYNLLPSGSSLLKKDLKGGERYDLESCLGGVVVRDSILVSGWPIRADTQGLPEMAGQLRATSGSLDWPP